MKVYFFRDGERHVVAAPNLVEAVKVLYPSGAPPGVEAFEVRIPGMPLTVEIPEIGPVTLSLAQWTEDLSHPALLCSTQVT